MSDPQSGAGRAVATPEHCDTEALVTPVEAVRRYRRGMGLVEDLGYVVPPAGGARRTLQSVAATRAGAAVFARTLPRADRVVARLSRGRVSPLMPLAAGLPVLVLTTTGRRSGLPRRTHLSALPLGEALVVFGTSFGRPSTPDWVRNLEADPRALVTHGGRTRAVRARPVTPVEEPAAWQAAREAYPGFLAYRGRVTGRRIRVFVLEPDQGAPSRAAGSSS